MTETTRVSSFALGFRILRTPEGKHTLQKMILSEVRGEFTEISWVDIPVEDPEGGFLGYQF